MLAVNEEYDHKNVLFASEKEESEANLMQNPLPVEKAYSYFGLLLGTFPPAAFFAKLILDTGVNNNNETWIIALMVLVNVVSAIVGYASGKLVGKAVLELEKYSWATMLLVLPFLGILWGVVSGGIGGIFLFVIGAVFGGVLGGMVGSVALPALTIFHRIFKRGDEIEGNQFMPIAFGVTLVISAFILGLPA